MKGMEKTPTANQTKNPVKIFYASCNVVIIAGGNSRPGHLPSWCVDADSRQSSGAWR